MKLTYLVPVFVLLGCGGEYPEPTAQQSYEVTSNTITSNTLTYFVVDGKILAEVESITIDGKNVPLDAKTSSLKKLENKTASIAFRPPGLACGHLVQAIKGVGRKIEIWQIGFPADVQGKIKKDISVIALKRDGAEARRWEVKDAFPTRWDPGEYSPSKNVACETVVSKMGSVELG